MRPNNNGLLQHVFQQFLIGWKPSISVAVVGINRKLETMMEWMGGAERKIEGKTMSASINSKLARRWVVVFFQQGKFGFEMSSELALINKLI